jgi:hypothetical protein
MTEGFRFYLGTHHPGWLSRLDVPLFVSNRSLSEMKTLPRARAPWALDSGGFTELSMYGEWRTTPRQYARDVRAYMDVIGKMEWASIQDWMCEEEIINGGEIAGRVAPGTKLTVEEHQRRTIRSYFELRDIAPEVPWVPVIQGFELHEYERHADMWEEALGHDLNRLPLVGLGSICRRQGTEFATRLVSRWSAGRGYRLHGFGMKKTGLKYLAGLITSADSLAWSYDARNAPPLAGCEGRHKACNNCPRYALKWREELFESVPLFSLGNIWQPPAAVEAAQAGLF